MKSWNVRAARSAGVLAAALVVVSTGVSSAYAALPPVEVSNDRFDPSAKLVGPEIKMDPFVGVDRDWRLRSFVDKKTGKVTNQLYVHITYPGKDWKYYETASDDTANYLTLNKVSSDASHCDKLFGCIYHEDVAVDFDEAALEGREGKIYEIKLSPKSGDGLIITISTEQIALQLAAIRDIQDSIADKAAGRPTFPKPIPPQGDGASAQFAQGTDEVLAAAKKVLQARGYTLSPVGADDNHIATVPLEQKLTVQDADCGRALGFPNVTDGRTKARMSLSLSLDSGKLTVRGGVDAVLQIRGFGAHEDRPLQCASKGAVEAEVLKDIQAALPQS